MSAFVVASETIVRILDWIKADELHGIPPYRSHYARQRFTDFDLSFDGDLQELGRALQRMNVEAVAQRYDERGEWAGVDVVYPPGSFADRAAAGGPVSILSNIAQVSIVEASVSMACLIYQCSEGDVPERDLYKALVEYSRDVAQAFVRQSPEWDEAVWG